LLAPGTVYVAPAGFQMTLAARGILSLRPADAGAGYSPSVTLLFESVARAYGPDAVGILLTGMGEDGAVGLLAMRERGATTICQDEESSIVYGMPQAAIRLGAAMKILSPPMIGRELPGLVGANDGERSEHHVGR
ncbi:MAG: chemotaxis protein CheB, partial [Nitrospinae bacterium]|nr:chemotaxis protein CheB [Nitrospinota bacterium]